MTSPTSLGQSNLTPTHIGGAPRRRSRRHGLLALFLAVGMIGVGCEWINPPPWQQEMNEEGTVDQPPPYNGPITNINEPIVTTDLPPGSSIEVVECVVLDMTHTPVTVGGMLGGDTQTCNTQVQVHLRGTGPLAGYDAMKFIPLVIQIDSAPRPYFAPFQSFDTRLIMVQGQIPPGDPDFDLLRITGGDMFGMPSPGHTTLTQLPGGQFSVDSFFDITYRVDFVGHPGGPFTGMSGSTTRTQHVQIGQSNPPLTLPPGVDFYTTHEPSQATFGGTSPLPPIPADFFYPGSEPFDGWVWPLRCDAPGLGGGNADTIIQRMGAATLPAIGSSADVPIELVQLSLQSVEPIQVPPSLREWDLRIGIEPVAAGTMHLTRDSNEGGTFTAELPVRPVFTFEPWEAGDPVLVLPSPTIITLVTAAPCQWSVNPPPGAPGGSGPGFYPVGEVNWAAPGLALRLGPATTIPSDADDATMFDMNADGEINGLDIQSAVQAILAGPVDPRFRKIDANTNGLFDAYDTQCLIANVLALPTGLDQFKWTNVDGAACDNSWRIIQNCPNIKKKLLIRAADVAESATECTVQWRRRTCAGVDKGEIHTMGAGDTTCVSVDRKDQIVVRCLTSPGTSCKISFKSTNKCP